MAKVKAAIFDIDGTLLDSVDLHADAWRQIFFRYGHDIPFIDIRVQIGKGGDQLMPVFLSEEELEKHGQEMEKERGKLFKQLFLPEVHPFPSVRALFEHLKADGIRLALASSSKKDELEHYAKLLGIDDLIDCGTSSDDARKSKPHPDIFQVALKKLGLAGEETLAIGDTPYDAEAAGKTGIKTIGMLCGGFLEPDLRKAGCIEIYQDPSDLLKRYAESAFARVWNAA